MSVQNNLREDLLQMRSKEFYMKHIVKSHNWYFSEYLRTPADEIIDRMDLFKELVSSNFRINFHNLQIVGSAKTGYSLSPQKVLRPFHSQDQNIKSSDIDIAIISERLFLEFWRLLRKTKEIRHNQYYYNRITASIFRGYINDKDLLRIKDVSQRWDEIVRPLNFSLQDKLGFEHPITYRLYRNWDDLEEYQIIGISKARAALEGSI